MAALLSPAQSKFVTAYLGVTVPEASEGAGAAVWKKAWKDARSAWQSASDRIDQQITSLQTALKGSDDPDLQEIGEFGLNAITGNHRVKMMAAIRDLDSSQGLPDKKIVAKAAGAIKDLEGHIKSDARIAALDDNPFGVTVSIAASMGAALTQVKSALRTGLSA